MLLKGVRLGKVLSLLRSRFIALSKGKVPKDEPTASRSRAVVPVFELYSLPIMTSLENRCVFAFTPQIIRIIDVFIPERARETTSKTRNLCLLSMRLLSHFYLVTNFSRVTWNTSIIKRTDNCGLSIQREINQCSFNFSERESSVLSIPERILIELSISSVHESWTWYDASTSFYSICWLGNAQTQTVQMSRFHAYHYFFVRHVDYQWGSDLHRSKSEDFCQSIRESCCFWRDLDVFWWFLAVFQSFRTFLHQNRTMSW